MFPQRLQQIKGKQGSSSFFYAGKQHLSTILQLNNQPCRQKDLEPAHDAEKQTVRLMRAEQWQPAFIWRVYIDTRWTEYESVTEVYWNIHFQLLWTLQTPSAEEDPLLQQKALEHAIKWSLASYCHSTVNSVVYVLLLSFIVKLFVTSKLEWSRKLLHE